MRKRISRWTVSVGLVGLYLLALSQTVKATNLKTIENDFTWDTYASSFTSVTSKDIDVAALRGFSYITGFEYRVLAVGSSATYTISHTTKTYSANAGNATAFNNASPQGLYSASLAPAISTTSSITIPAGTTVRDVYEAHFQAQTINPVWHFSSLSVAATYYLYVEYGIPK